LEAVDKKKTPTPTKNEKKNERSENSKFKNEKNSKFKNEENEKEDKSCEGACLEDLARYLGFIGVYVYICK
jgi:hypothetical protein